MKPLCKITASLLLVASFAGATAAADDKPLDFRFDAGVGATYDSNVALVDLDSSAGEPDTATVLEAGLGVRANFSRNAWLKVDYDYSGTRYRQFTDYDLDLHHAHVSLGGRRGAVDGVLAFDHFKGVLDGDDYLDHSQVSPAISRLFGSRWFLRGAYTRAEKTYEAYADRDATSDALRVDAYLLIDGMDHYLSLAAQALTEEARHADHSFDGMLAQLGWGYRIGSTLTDITLKAQVRLERRTYDAFILDSGETRVDDRARATLAAVIPFSDHVWVGARIEHTRNTSELPAAELDRTVYGMELGITF